MEDKLKYEYICKAKGKCYIAGVDEVGRGPLAGPVVCAAVIMPLEPESIIEGVDDSKKLTQKKREQLCKEILARATDVKICQISVDEIDRINILAAVKKCMAMCIDGLSVKPDMVLTDAVKIDIGCEQLNIIKGDQKSYTIGAASIVAKVYRDRLMQDYDKEYPGYGFAAHKGYGTKAHIDRIKENGPCQIHRKTFIGNFWAQTVKDGQQDS